MKINEENCKSFENGRNVMKLWITNTVSTQETKQANKETNKQTNKQNNLLTLTVSFEKRSCLIRKNNKWMNK